MDVVGIVSQLCGAGRRKTWDADSNFSVLVDYCVLDFATDSKTTVTLLCFQGMELFLLLDASLVDLCWSRLRISSAIFVEMEKSNRLGARS